MGGCEATEGHFNRGWKKGRLKRDAKPCWDPDTALLASAIERVA